MGMMRKHPYSSFELNSSILALSGGFRLLLPFYAGLFIMLTPADFCQDARTGAFTLKPFKSTLQRLVFSNTDFHFLIPPL
jgi:hypothetical protein